MSVKLHFLLSLLDYFPKKWENLSEEKGELFHLNIRIMQELYHSWWDVNFLTDYCWYVKRNAVTVERRRKFLKRHSFVYFPAYYGTMWAFYENISPNLCIICWIQQENKQNYNTVLYISSKSWYLKHLNWLKIEYNFGNQRTRLY